MQYVVTAGVLTGMRDVFAKTVSAVVSVRDNGGSGSFSFYRPIPVSHLQAGLLSYNISSPWPEEMNCQITRRIASYIFSPIPLSKKIFCGEMYRRKSILTQEKSGKTAIVI